LLLGERARFMVRGDELQLACPVCGQRLLAEGYAAVTTDVESSAVDEGSLTLAG
jgi:hypothetical protein